MTWPLPALLGLPDFTARRRIDRRFNVNKKGPENLGLLSFTIENLLLISVTRVAARMGFAILAL